MLYVKVVDRLYIETRWESFPLLGVTGGSQNGKLAQQSTNG